jgi:Xaa-Pro aminopeptidase
LYNDKKIDKVIQKAISSIQVGLSKWKISNVIVASGPYSAQPHYRTTEKEVVDDDSVLIDIGGIRKYYRSDMT